MQGNKTNEIKRPRSLRLFSTSPENEKRKIADLEDKISKLNDTPEKTYRILAIDLFNEGKIDEGIEFATEALKCNENIFNCAVIKVRSYKKITQLEKLNELIPQAIILSGERITDQHQSELANYYKKLAMKKMAETRKFSALRLFDEALKCNPSILGSRIDVYLPYVLKVVSSFFGMDKISPDERDVLTTVGVDCVILNSIDFKNAKIQPILFNLSDKEEINRRVKDTDLLSDLFDRSVVSLVNSIAALGYVHLLRWSITADDNQNLYYQPSENKCDLMVFFSVIGFASAMQPLVNDNSLDTITRGMPVLTPLITAVIFSQAAAIQCLLELGSDVNQLEENDQTPLIALSAISHIKGIECLLKLGALIDRPNSLGTTPLMMAAYHARTNVINYLIEHHADANTKDLKGFSALMHASRFGGFENLGMLIGVPISGGVTREKVDTIRLLHSHRAEINSEDLDELSPESRSILEYAIESHDDSEESFRLLSENIGNHKKCTIS